MPKYRVELRRPIVHYPFKRHEYFAMDPERTEFSAANDSAAKIYAERYASLLRCPYRGKMYEAELKQIVRISEEVVHTYEEKPAAVVAG